MNLSRCLMLFALAAAAVLPGCTTRSTSVGPVPPGAEYRTGLTLEPGFARDLGFTSRWARVVPLSRGQSIHAAVTLGDLLIVVERPNNVVSALKVSDGSPVWKKILGDDLEVLYSPVGDEDNIYVNTGRRIFTLSRRDGEIDKIANLAHPVESGPTLVGQLAIFGSGSGRVFGHHVFHGYKKWVYGLNSPIETRPVVENNQLFVADTQGQYAMLESATGELRWRGRTFGPITANPILDGAFIIVASQDQSLYSFNATTGRERWDRFRSEVPLSQTPTALDGIIYLPEPGIGLTAVDATTGESRWTLPNIKSPVATHRGGVLVHDRESITLIDIASGSTTQTVPTRPLEMIATGPGDSLILVSEQGDLLRLDPN